MNILVKTYSGKIISRPDTTWEKDSEDFFPQDFVDSISFSPVLFARICKPGKSVQKRFASRYYDSVNFGILLYPEDLIDGSPEGFACASCLNHTSFMPVPLFSPDVLSETDNLSISRNGKEIYNGTGCSRELIEDALSEATSRIYIRTGDFIAIELASRKILNSRTMGNAHIVSKYNGNPLLDFNIIIE